MTAQNTPITEEDRPAPPFIPQGPPPKLGVMRSVLLVLMAAIGTVELVLFSGVFLLRSVPAVSVPTAQITASDSSFTSYVQPPGASGTNLSGTLQDEPVDAIQSQTGVADPAPEDASTPQTPIEGERPGDDAPTQASPAQEQNTAPDSQPPGNGNQPEELPVAAPAQKDEISGSENAKTTDTAIPDPQGRTIYITPTGKRYHYNNRCNGGTYIESSLEEALSLGLTPCKKCVL